MIVPAVYILIPATIALETRITTVITEDQDQGCNLCKLSQDEQNMLKTKVEILGTVGSPNYIDSFPEYLDYVEDDINFFKHAKNVLQPLHRQDYYDDPDHPDDPDHHDDPDDPDDHDDYDDQATEPVLADMTPQLLFVDVTPLTDRFVAPRAMADHQEWKEESLPVLSNNNSLGTVIETKIEEKNTKFQNIQLLKHFNISQQILPPPASFPQGRDSTEKSSEKSSGKSKKSSEKSELFSPPVLSHEIDTLLTSSNSLIKELERSRPAVKQSVVTTTPPPSPPPSSPSSPSSQSSPVSSQPSTSAECPGKSLRICIGVCQPWDLPAVYRACVRECIRRC